MCLRESKDDDDDDDGINKPAKKERKKNNCLSIETEFYVLLYGRAV